MHRTAQRLTSSLNWWPFISAYFKYFCILQIFSSILQKIIKDAVSNDAFEVKGQFKLL